MCIAVIADSHLSARTPECVSNWEAAAAVVARLGAELTIHLGDISLDGQNHPDELLFAAEAVRRWPTPMLCVPGNHDMGDGSGEFRYSGTRKLFENGKLVREKSWEKAFPRDFQ